MKTLEEYKAEIEDVVMADSMPVRPDVEELIDEAAKHLMEREIDELGSFAEGYLMREDEVYKSIKRRS